ncbi:uncharacterized protein GGS22DRAFT_191323 [Annulohypoxylon maeteangense]|uniref:uncharacterized protein n=1 Tax=Annulohypoxylon maeteangense TaxID=1927788 RepID=UPI002008C7CA|nr:uncharacterized protein GGS22DRAFT_191323 [Annulohypoxylon maeteangense]KAI0882152.1 hypothetical protein GGS22DRAFT_191323 [Annulohypoxylon maeteangense]
MAELSLLGVLAHLRRSQRFVASVARVCGGAPYLKEAGLADLPLSQKTRPEDAGTEAPDLLTAAMACAVHEAVEPMSYALGAKLDALIDQLLCGFSDPSTGTFLGIKRSEVHGITSATSAASQFSETT